MRITALTDAPTAYNALIDTPRSKNSNRRALLRELETRTAMLVEMTDDLVVQFDGTEAGKLFIKAWFQARVIVDAGRRSARDSSAARPDAA